MNAVNQPENTTKTNVRDAAVQIGGEDKGLLIKELFHVEQGIDKPKRNKAWDLEEGIYKRYGNLNEGKRDPEIVAFELCLIIQNLTSSFKADRDYGKKTIRELVKLGKGE